MTFNRLISTVVDDLGITRIAAQSGLSKQALYNLMDGTEPRPQTKQAVIAACSNLARELVEKGTQAQTAITQFAMKEI